MANQIVWCDIPVLDLDRAVGFYSAVLGRQVAKQEFSGITMGCCPITTARLGGAWSKVRQKSRPMECHDLAQRQPTDDWTMRFQR